MAGAISNGDSVCAPYYAMVTRLVGIDLSAGLMSRRNAI